MPRDEFALLVEERDRLIFQHRRAQRHRKRLKAHAESLEALLRHAHQERHRLSESLHLVGMPLPHATPSALSTSFSAPSLRCIAAEGPQRPCSSVCSREAGKGDQGLRIERLVEARHAKPHGLGGGRGLCTRNRRQLREPSDVSEQSSSDDEVGSISSESLESAVEPPIPTALPRGLRSGTKLSPDFYIKLGPVQSSMHATPGEVCRHGNQCTSCTRPTGKALDTPTSSPSLASLSTRSGSQATFSTGSLASQRSAAGFAASLPSTPEVDALFHAKRHLTPTSSPLASIPLVSVPTPTMPKDEGFGVLSPESPARRISVPKHVSNCSLQSSLSSRILRRVREGRGDAGHSSQSLSEACGLSGLSKVTSDRLKARAEQTGIIQTRSQHSLNGLPVSLQRKNCPTASLPSNPPVAGHAPRKQCGPSVDSDGTSSRQRHSNLESPCSPGVRSGLGVSPGSAGEVTIHSVKIPTTSPRSALAGTSSTSSVLRTVQRALQRAPVDTPPVAPPPLSPRSLARQRRYDRESWARRGLSDASPPPRECTGRENKGAGHVRVVVRCRPLSAEDQSVAARRETAPADDTLYGVHIVDSTTIEVREPGLGKLPKRFTMDQAFGVSAKTGDVFTAILGLAHAAIAGASSVVLAYGPSGSGKTHTMYGSMCDQGIVQRAAAELFGNSGGKPVWISMLELHNETLVDLLIPRGQNSHPLEVRGGSAGAMASIEGAREVPGLSLASLLVTIRGGLARRQVAATLANATSSRSHVIVVFGIGSGKLTLVDLAGLERVKRSGAEGSLLREAQCINRSLQSLGDVVEALRRGAQHVPCRNSKLARLISGALGGGSQTTVVVCVAPGAGRCDEAITALCFAEKVRRIPTNAGATAVSWKCGSTV